MMGNEEPGVDCNETITRLYNFLDGELTDQRRHDIQKHLDDCSPCLEAYDFEAELRHVIANGCRDNVPDSLRQRVLAALVQEEKLQAQRRKGRRQP